MASQCSRYHPKRFKTLQADLYVHGYLARRKPAIVVTGNVSLIWTAEFQCDGITFSTKTISKHPKFWYIQGQEAPVYGYSDIKTCNRGHGAPSQKMQIDAKEEIATPGSAQPAPPFPQNQCWVPIARPRSVRNPAIAHSNIDFRGKGVLAGVAIAGPNIDFGGRGGGRRLNFLALSSILTTKSNFA